jgi:hypothetical protein
MRPDALIAAPETRQTDRAQYRSLTFGLCDPARVTSIAAISAAMAARLGTDLPDRFRYEFRAALSVSNSECFTELRCNVEKSIPRPI